MSAPPSNAELRPIRETLSLPVLLGSIGLTLISTLLALWLPRLLGDMVDALVEEGLEPAVLLRQTAFYLAVALVGALFSKWMRQVPMRWGPRISHRLRGRLHRHLLDLDESQIRRRRVGELMSRLQSDVNAVADMLSLGGHSAIRAFFTLGIAFAFMFRRSAPLALVMSLLLPMMMLIGYGLLRSIRSRHLQVQEQLGALTTYCQESFGGLRVLRGLGLETLRLGRFRDLNTEYITRNLRLSRVEILTWPLIHTGFMLGNVLLLWAGGIRVIEGDISLGMLVEFQQYLMILQWPTLSIAWTLSLVLRGKASLTRLREVMEDLPQVTDAGSPRLDPSPGPSALRFENVFLSLEGTPVLRGVSADIPAGGMLGVTGPTGSGKTQLLNLLLRRQHPDAGRILLDGRDIADLPLETLYRVCRIAPQEPVLFSMTLEENLRLAAPEATEEELRRALYLSAMDRDLEQLPKGLDSAIGERGVTLSGGQRQRCAIARALLSDPPMLLLDDSLSAVDSATESMILDRLLPAVRGRTLVLVSHRYAALRHCDRVLVLRDGAVDQWGTPGELLSRPGYFAELAERQRLRARLEVEE